MRNRLLTGGLLLAATTLLTSQAALALPPRGEVVGTTATQNAPATWTPTASPVRASLVQGFTVTADSVVATATVRYGGSGIVSVRWGDNTRSTFDPSRPQVNDSNTTASPGMVVFKHEYATADGSQFTMIATASVESGGNIDFDSRQVVVTPRFLVSQYQAFFTPLNHCDTSVEEYSEWRIEQKLNGSVVRTWWQDRDTGVGFPGAEIGGVSPDFRALEGSLIHREMVMADAPLVVGYEVTELDEVFDDQAGEKHIDLHPSMQPASITLEFSGDDCRAQVKADTDLRLLKPGYSQGPVISQSMG